MLEQFSRFGRELFLPGVNSSHSGNMKAAMVRGHGSFAVGQMLEEAFQWTSSLEPACKTPHLSRLLSPRGDREEEGRW